MKVKQNIIEKLILIILYVESVAYLDRHIMLAISLLLFALSFHFQGAKPYWPMFLLILVLQYFDLSSIQMLAMIVAGFLLTVIKLYEIPVPEKGELNSGYKAGVYQDLEFCIFYPTKQLGKKANWFPNKNYFKTLYQIFYVVPQTKRMPYFIFAFLVSFLTKVTMPALLDTKLYTADQNQSKKYKVVVFSHGLGGNMNSYSSICAWFASHGYLVVSVQHSHDQVCVDHRHSGSEDHWKIRDYLYSKRNRDLTIRVAQVRKVVMAIAQNNFFKTNLGTQIIAQEIHLAGQSYGGGTILQTVAELIKQKKQHLIKSVIALDPWMFPLNEDSYQVIKNQNILIINSQTFWESTSIPYIYQLEKKFAVFRASNVDTLKAVMITKMNHLDQTDMAFVFGNIMEFLRKNSHYYLNQQIMQLNLLLISLFLEGTPIKQMIEAGNKFCKDSQLDKAGFQLMEQFRVQRQMMLQFQKERQAIVDKLMTKKQLVKRLFWS